MSFDHRGALKMKKLLLLGGFLGTKSDLDPLKEDLEALDFSISSMDLLSFKKLDLEEKKDYDAYVAYSMGGRYILRNLDLLWNEKKKFIFLSTGLGLDPKDKSMRRAWEDTVLEKIKSSTYEEFHCFWNGLEVFQNDSHKDFSLEWQRKKDWAQVFEDMRLSESPRFHTTFKELDLKAFLGEKDFKYQKIYNQIDYEIIPGVGHRLHLKPAKILSQKIRDYIYEC